MLAVKRGKKRVVLWIAVAVVLIALVWLTIYLKRTWDYRKAVRDITFQGIDVSQIADGVYVGDCDVDFIYAKVEVTVQEGKITNIALLAHKNDRGSTAETVIDKIVAEQKIQVDAVAGATNSSTVLKKAVENALVR